MNSVTKLLATAGLLLVSTHAMAQAVADGPPEPPKGAAATLVIPPRDAAGSYLTPNRELTPEAAGWHVRSALNVAALNCRDAQEEATIAAYNGFLAAERAPLAADNLAVQAQYHARFGKSGQDRYDATMTRVYNFFAQPPAHDGFCAAAREVLAAAANVAPSAYNTFAVQALAKLDQPFTTFYAAYDQYRVSLAQWRVHGGPGEGVVAIASVTAPPVLVLGEH